VAELVRSELGQTVELVRGRLGELTVWVDGRRVFKKGWFSFPADAAFVTAIREALGGSGVSPSAEKATLEG
jgi:hypothetical protein